MSTEEVDALRQSLREARERIALLHETLRLNHSQDFAVGQGDCVSCGEPGYSRDHMGVEDPPDHTDDCKVKLALEDTQDAAHQLLAEVWSRGAQVGSSFSDWPARNPYG